MKDELSGSPQKRPRRIAAVVAAVLIVTAAALWLNRSMTESLEDIGGLVQSAVVSLGRNFDLDKDAPPPGSSVYFEDSVVGYLKRTGSFRPDGKESTRSLQLYFGQWRDGEPAKRVQADSTLVGVFSRMDDGRMIIRLVPPGSVGRRDLRGRLFLGPDQRNLPVF
jgi:hypothetical protein